jgi:formylglycine-generating enzyme required for sulfatase activity
METPYGLLRVIAKAALNAVGGGVAGDVLVEILPDIGKDVWAWWSKDRDEAGRKADIEALAQMPTATLRKEAEQVVAEVAPDRSAAERGRVAGYLSLLPSVIRQSLRRPEDPSGKSVPRTLSLRRPEDMIPFLPPRVPRFKPGDHPLPGVDLVLVKMLGAGGFGEVWEARNPHLPGNDPVALKFCLDPTAARVLRNEVAILARVMKQGRHPGIVPLLHTYLSADPPCLEYEYVSGGDLVSGVHTALQKGPLTPDTAARMVLNLARTIGFAHRLSPPIVHRDLKPANILLVHAAMGLSSDLLIVDFGIGGIAARQALDAEIRLSGLASMSILVGSHTPLYASPQQRQGAPPDPRDDVHALGVIWYQLLIGDLTKGVPTGRAWTQKLAARGVPTGMVDLLADCIEEDPEGRPRDAQVLAERLNTLLTASSIAAVPAAEPKETAAPKEPVAQPKPGDVSTNSLGMRFAFVPRGSFWMGGGAGTPGDEEVTIKHDFRIGVYPVMQGQWQAVMGNNPSHFARTGDGKDDVKDVSDAELKDFPVERVSWDDVQKFLGKLNEREKDSGFVYRLPTEVEWEYACRGAALSSAGSMSKEECSFDFYFAQPTNALSSRQANFNGKYPCGGAGKGPYLGRTCKVGSYQPNRLGIYDLHGNVWEWCQDTDDGGETRVFRGGGCYDGAKHCRASTRDGGEPGWSGGHVGVRLVLVL